MTVKEFCHQRLEPTGLCCDGLKSFISVLYCLFLNSNFFNCLRVCLIRLSVTEITHCLHRYETRTQSILYMYTKSASLEKITYSKEYALNLIAFISLEYTNNVYL